MPTEQDLYDFIKENCETRPAPYPEIRVDCPRCRDKKKFKLYVNVKKRVWDCKVCGYGSADKNISSLLSDLSGISESQIDAKFGKTTPTNAVTFLSSLESVLGESSNGDVYAEIRNKMITDSLKKTEVVQQTVVKKNGTVHHYLCNRGIDSATMKKFKIRQASHVNKFIGDFAVFNMRDYNGDEAFQARRADGKLPKYISSSNINKCLYPDIPINHDLIKSRKLVVLVEGIFDAIGCINNGYGAYCAFGNTLTKEQVNLLRCDLAEDVEIVIAFDADLPTRLKVAKLVGALTPHFKKISVVDTSKNPKGDGEKVDFGDVLKDPTLASWLQEAIFFRFDTDSNEYFKWMLETKIIGGLPNEQINSRTGGFVTHDR